jgi:lipopolysaccharide transport system permease protein
MSNVTSINSVSHVQVSAGVPGPLLDFPELVRFRDLVWTLTDRDLRVRYKQTAFGVIWVVLQPLTSALIFAFVFGFIAKMPSDGKPYLVFAFAGLTAWTTFSNVLSRVSASLVSNAQLLSKIYFPRLILPLSSAMSALVDSAFSLGFMFVLLVVYQIWPGWGILLLPIFLLILILLSLGLGLSTASWMVSYRDVGHIIPVALSLGMFISPVAWSLSNPNLSEKYRILLRLNPLCSPIEAIRWSLLGEGQLPLIGLAYSAVVAVAVFWIGATVFKEQERSFADVI